MTRLGWLIIVAFLIGGCAGKPTAQSPESLRELLCTEGWTCVSGPEDTPPPSSTESGRGPNAPSPPPTTFAASARQQIFISEIHGTVFVRETLDGNFVSAQSGMLVPAGASIQTNASSRARLTIRPEGTAINIGQNSSLIIKSLLPSGRQSDLRITLNAGKIWVLPRGGQIAVKTEIGTASSNGSPLGVRYDSDSANLEASCLEGLCSLKNDQGEIILTSGMMAVISGGNLPYSSEQMNGDMLQEWVDENSNLTEYFGGKVPGWLPSPDVSGN